MADGTPVQPKPPISDHIARLLAPYVVPHPEFLQALDDQLHAFQVSYRDTGNPLWVWKAVLACGSAKSALPDWVMSYLVRAAERFSGLLQSPPANPTKAIAGALEMKLTGPGSVFARLDDSRELMIAERMHWHIKGGLNETNAKYVVSGEENVSEATALRAWHKHRALFENPPTKP